MPFGHPAPSQSSLRLAIIKSSSTLRHLTAYEKQDGPTQLLVAQHSAGALVLPEDTNWQPQKINHVPESNHS